MSLLAVRPPEYFPRPEYYALMSAVDVFVLADTFQYSRQSFQNRARIRTPDGWSWLSIPLQGGQHGRPICGVQVDVADKRWPVRHWLSLEYNYRSSPFFEFYEDTVAPAVRPRGSSLSSYTVETVRAVKEMLHIDTTIVLASELDGNLDEVESVLEHYPGSKLWTLPDSEETDIAASSVVEWVGRPYVQNFRGFEPGMSTLDLVFNLGPSAADRVRAFAVRPREDRNQLSQ